MLQHQALALVHDLTTSARESARRVLLMGEQRGWADSTIQNRLAQVIGLDPRRAEAVDRFREARLKDGVKPSRAEALTKQYARRLLIQRCRFIADQEVFQAYSSARRLLWRDMQASGDLSTYAVRVTIVHKDERLCSICRPQNGVRRSLRDVQSGPPFHPRCRCYEEVQDRGVETQEDVHMSIQKDGPDGSMLYVPAPLGEKAAPKAKKKKRKRPKSVEEALSKAVSPGGRPADASPLAKPGNEGPRRLVDYVRMIAHALMRKGMDKSHAIAVARSTLARWASGQGHVSPKVRAAAAKALAEQQALDKARRIVKSDQIRWNLEDYQAIVKQIESEGR